MRNEVKPPFAYVEAETLKLAVQAKEAGCA